MSFVATSPAGRWQHRLESLPPIIWPLLQSAALWTHWRWAAARLADGSDDPLGMAALAALLFAIGRLAPTLRARPQPGWLVIALLLSVAATVGVYVLPPLLAAMLAVLALACTVRAFLPSHEAGLPLAGLAVLALPVMSSLQFYAGYPLRVLTAQLSTWALQLAGFAAMRSGSSMEVEGRLVIVDAPCSGLQMVWFAYFTACAVAAFAGVSDRRFMARLPLVGLLVLAGNVLRNTLLVAWDARAAPMPASLHEAVGLLVLVVVCGGVVALLLGGRNGSR